MLDNRVPLKEMKSIDKPHKPYYNKYIKNQQKIVKTRERTWLKYREHCQWQALQERKKYLQQIITVSQEAMHCPSSSRKQQIHQRPLQAYEQANQQQKGKPTTK